MLDLLIGDAIGRSRDSAGELQQQSLGLGETRGVEVTVAQRVRRLPERLALQLQEPRVCAQSIPAFVEGGNVRRDHLVLGTGERAVGEMHS